MIKQMPITEARKEINSLHRSLDREDIISVTNRGEKVLAILPWKTYEAITETLEIISDPDMMDALNRGIADYKSGKTEDWESVKEALELA